METKKYLGKIVKAEFGKHHDLSYFGLSLEFSFDGSRIGSGVRYMCKNTGCLANQYEEISLMNLDILVFLSDAKVNFVYELVNRPVEIELIGDTFKSFRILTEVL